MFKCISSIIKKIGINIFQESKTIENVSSEGKALKHVKKLYEGFNIIIEKIPDGMAYFIEFKNNRYQIANYDFKNERLWYRLPKTYIFKKLRDIAYLTEKNY